MSAAEEPSSDGALRRELERERELRAAVERRLADTRDSESYRIGQRLVLVVRGWRRFTRLRGLRRLPLPVPSQAARGSQRSDDGYRSRLLVVAVGRPITGNEITALADALGPAGIVLLTDTPVKVGEGVLVERVVGYEAWVRHRRPADWAAYVTARIGAVTRHHRPRTTLALHDAARPLTEAVGLVAPLVLDMRSEQNAVA